MEQQQAQIADSQSIHADLDVCRHNLIVASSPHFDPSQADGLSYPISYRQSHERQMAQDKIMEALFWLSKDIDAINEEIHTANF